MFKLCFVVAEKSSLVDIDPKQFCGFNPCDISKCLLAPLGSCVSDYKCRPVFFDENNKRLESCVGKFTLITSLKNGLINLNLTCASTLL
jgi:hypothetical protein